MSSELLFRIWNKQNNSWQHNDWVIYNDKTHIGTLVMDKYCICQQFVGVSDRSGKKIFEGDILKVNHADNFGIGKVVRIKGGFCIESKYGAPFMDSVSTMEHSEVIGNIFEHPNLLGK